MIEFLKHAFVLIVSPAVVVSIAGYSIWKRHFLLGAGASFGTLVACVYVANILFDRNLLVYGLVFSAMLPIPAGLIVVGLLGWVYWASRAAYGYFTRGKDPTKH